MIKRRPLRQIRRFLLLRHLGTYKSKSTLELKHVPIRNKYRSGIFSTLVVNIEITASKVKCVLDSHTEGSVPLFILEFYSVLPYRVYTKMRFLGETHYGATRLGRRRRLP